MKSLFKRSALASILLLTTLGAQAGSLSSETSGSDNIVIGAATGKVSIKVMGYENLMPQEQNRGEIVGTVFAKTNSLSDREYLVVTYASQHKPTASGGFISGTLKNEAGDELETTLRINNSLSLITKNINGEPWTMASQPGFGELSFLIQSTAGKPLKVGVYPITLRAAIYQP